MWTEFNAIIAASLNPWPIVSALSPIVIAIAGYAKSVWNRREIQDKESGLRARVVRCSTDSLFVNARELYEGDKRLPEDVRVAWELLMASQQKRENVWYRLSRVWRIDTIYIVGGREKDGHVQPSGLLSCATFRPRNVAFIPFFINDKKDVYARTSKDTGLILEPSDLTILMFRKLQQALASPFWPLLIVKELYGELEDPQHFEPAREARARIEFFRRLAQRQNWYFYKVEIPYTQPFTDLYDLEDAAKQIPRRQEKPMWLVVFLTDPQKQTISRERISEGLTFIINQYRTAEREPARAEKYGRYLDDWFARMENSITTNAVSLERIAPWKRYLH